MFEISFDKPVDEKLTHENAITNIVATKNLCIAIALQVGWRQTRPCIHLGRKHRGPTSVAIAIRMAVTLCCRLVPAALRDDCQAECHLFRLLLGRIDKPDGLL
jgi:hypothetical protein